jgi:hypothetical protein
MNTPIHLSGTGQLNYNPQTPNGFMNQLLPAEIIAEIFSYLGSDKAIPGHVCHYWRAIYGSLLESQLTQTAPSRIYTLFRGLVQTGSYDRVMEKAKELSWKDESFSFERHKAMKIISRLFIEREEFSELVVFIKNYLVLFESGFDDYRHINDLIINSIFFYLVESGKLIKAFNSHDWYRNHEPIPLM